MKKIMFNDKYRLTQAVLEGRKTQTRRIIKMPDYDEEYLDTAFDWDFRESVIIDRCAKYSIGEIVAIAQSYKNIGYQPTDKTPIIRGSKIEFIEFQKHKGWNNKMFTSSDNMINFIRITNVRIQRLQDISDDDCLKEGIEFDGKAKLFYYGFNKSTNSKIWLGSTPREAYASLIDKICGKGTWDRNPYVFVYDFELLF